MLVMETFSKVPKEDKTRYVFLGCCEMCTIIFVFLQLMEN